MFFYIVVKNHKLWKTIENTVISIWNCYLAVSNKCENSKPSLRKSAWKMHRKRNRKSSEKCWKTTSTNMIQTLLKTCKFRLFFSIKSTRNPSKTMKKRGSNIDLEIDTIFYRFSQILVLSWDPLGPPWAPFFLQNATRVPGWSASGRVLVISAWLFVPLEPLGPLWIPFCHYFHIILVEFQ